MACAFNNEAAGKILLPPAAFFFFSWVGERTNFTGFHDQVAEELAEFGAYMMMYMLLKDADKILRLFSLETKSVSSYNSNYMSDESRILNLQD